MLYCEGTQHTPQSYRDFPVSFAFPGALRGESSGKCPSTWEVPLTGFPSGKVPESALALGRFFEAGSPVGVPESPSRDCAVFCYFSGRGAQNLWEGPLSFWSPEGGQKNELKN